MSNEQDPGHNLPEEATQRRQGTRYLTPEESWQIKVELVKQVNRLKAENASLRSTCARASVCIDRWAEGKAFDVDGPGGRIREELHAVQSLKVQP